MVLFDNIEPEEFLLFVWNFQVTLNTSGTIASSLKIHYLHTLLRGESVRQIDMLSIELESTTISHLNSIFLGLSMHFSLVIYCQIKVCDAPRNEEVAYIKSDTLR